jgi:two-component system, OmpR family, osmolarity sensor histidine kinase EnvZ
MLGRLGFAGRLMAITLLALLALWALGAGVSYVTQGQRLLPRRTMPLPAQIAAVVQLLETAPPAHRETIPAAVNSDILTVTVQDRRPEDQPSLKRLPAVEWYTRRYAEALAGRDVIATVDRADVPPWRGWPLRDYWRYSIRPMRVTVSLKGGGYASFETRGEISRRLLGLPPGFWLGALGSLIGIAALLAISREAGPLKDLSRAVTHFSRDGQPLAVEPRGAPEIRKLIAAVNGMQERIAALLKGRTILFGAISHDLKTYITRLRLRCEGIEDQHQRSRAERDLEEMTSLLDGALAVARGGAVPRKDQTADLALLLHAIAETPGIELGALPECLHVNADAIALRRLFDNLTSNALRFGGRCRLSMRQDRDRAQVFVDDDGGGIPESERQAVFEPFYRLEGSRSRSTGGTGLGLTIAKQIAEAHGGSIAIETSPLGGARLKVTLPLEAHGLRPA